MTNQQMALLFPGQGSQYPGMGKSFYDAFSETRHTFEEAEELLGRRLRDLVFSGGEDELRRTSNSQVAIFVTSVALLRAIAPRFPFFEQVAACAGLSLGEYTALVAAGVVSFDVLLPVVALRGRLMEEACRRREGGMALFLGAEANEVENTVEAINRKLPAGESLVVANYNCPGQAVVSGSKVAIAAFEQAGREQGKRMRSLNVQGAFHSPLMAGAQDQLHGAIAELPIASEGTLPLVMNVPGDFVADGVAIRDHLIAQVTSPVRWEQGVHAMCGRGVTEALEIGCGKVLGGFCKRIDAALRVRSIEQVSDLSLLEKMFEERSC